MQKAALFAALCRASGIPARIGFQDIRDYMIVGDFLRLMGTNELSHHGMNTVFLNGRWVMADCTLDSGLANRKRYRLVEFDGTRHALLPKTSRTGKPHFDILKQYRFYNDTTAVRVELHAQVDKGSPSEGVAPAGASERRVHVGHAPSEP